MQQLKINLQQLGPLQPLAWNKILSSHLSVNLLAHENFICKAGTIAFLSNGILKAYDARQRKKPSIINFIQNHQFFIMRKENQTNFIRACVPSLIHYIEWEEAENLYKQFRELKMIYDGISESYEECTAYRQIVLEEKTAVMRIQRFINVHRNILPYLKKKDMANYLHLDYDHFVRLYHKTL